MSFYLHCEVRNEGVIWQENVKKSLYGVVVGVNHPGGDQSGAEPVLHVRSNVERVDIGLL